MNTEKFKFVFGDDKPSPESLCFAYNRAERSLEQLEAARQAQAARMKDAEARQAVQRGYDLPELKGALRECPFCSFADGVLVDKDPEGWYFVFCSECGARGPRTRDGYLAAAWLWKLLRTDNEDPLLERSSIL